MQKLLEGIRVLDITQAYSGPFCAMHLADHGAEVIKVEPVNGEQTRVWGPIKDGYSAYFACLNRNKKGLAIDLKSDAGKEALRRLIQKSDVVIENFKVGTFSRLGFSYETLKALKPDIIYAQLTGFGLTGPMRDRAAYDIVAQAEGGLMSMNGYPENDPVKVGPSIADSASGTFLSLAIMMALFKRERTGEGCHVNVSMLDSVFALSENFAVDYTLMGKVSIRPGNRGCSMAPWDLYHARDGLFVTGCGTNRLWKLFSQVMDLPDLTDDPNFATPSLRVERAQYLQDRIEAVTKELTLDEVERRLVGAGIPFGRVNTLAQVTQMEQIKERNMLWDIYDPGLKCQFRMPGTPMKFSTEPDTITCAAPTVGQDNEEILASLGGYSTEEIKRLYEAGVINKQ